jgi:hypothetical protein
MTASRKEIFNATTRDKIRLAFSKGRRSYVLKGIKYTLKAATKKGYFTVRPADGSKAPFALLETVQLRTQLDKKTGEAIALYAKKVKEGKQERPNFDARRKKKAKD